MPDTETVTKDDVLEALRDVYDPEIPVNIVDLGLVYGVEVADGDVDVSMTLTFAGCGMGPYIAQQAEWRLAEVEGIEDINVDEGKYRTVVTISLTPKTMLKGKGRKGRKD